MKSAGNFIDQSGKMNRKIRIIEPQADPVFVQVFFPRGRQFESLFINLQQFNRADLPAYNRPDQLCGGLKWYFGHRRSVWDFRRQRSGVKFAVPDI